MEPKKNTKQITNVYEARNLILDVCERRKKAKESGALEYPDAVLSSDTIDAVTRMLVDISHIKG